MRQERWWRRTAPAPAEDWRHHRSPGLAWRGAHQVAQRRAVMRRCVLSQARRGCAVATSPCAFACANRKAGDTAPLPHGDSRQLHQGSRQLTPDFALSLQNPIFSLSAVDSLRSAPWLKAHAEGAFSGGRLYDECRPPRAGFAAPAARIAHWSSQVRRKTAMDHADRGPADNGKYITIATECTGCRDYGLSAQRRRHPRTIRRRVWSVRFFLAVPTVPVANLRYGLMSI